jgi:nicotinate-nucleotide adenylyltransferase
MLKKYAPYPALPKFGSSQRHRTIGVLGGSFNPPHEGHLAMSIHALKVLDLDEVWWLVTPQNPLKNLHQYISLDTRMEAAKQLTHRHAKIQVVAYEQFLGTRYTVHSLELLKKRFPHTRFIWLMGSDCVVNLPQWQHWPHLFKDNKLAIFRRLGYITSIGNQKAIKRFSRFRRRTMEGCILKNQSSPAWVMLQNPYHPASSTALRAKLYPGSSECNN